MPLFTCLACKVVFEGGIEQRTHYKTEWHRYNLKRRVAELPPISCSDFEEKLLLLAPKEEDNQQTFYKCCICERTFSSQNALDNHSKSKRHAARSFSNSETNETQKQEKVIQEILGEKEMNIDEDSDSSWEDIDDDELGVCECFFCQNTTDSLEENLHHMSSVHSFFIPDVDYVSDIEGLVEYLGEKISVGFLCLWCNEAGKSFHSLKAVQRHMLDKGHCKVLFENDAIQEYAQYYDYTRLQDSHVGALDSEQSPGFELVLPTGAVVGHRSLARYYRQNLPTKPHARQRQTVMHKIMSHYRALGWTGISADVASQRAKDIAGAMRQRNKQWTRLGVKANKLQKHFKDQNSFKN